MSNRQQTILDELDRRGACTYQELANLLNVSAMTIRRDAESLAQHGLVVKVLCGVQKAAGTSSLYETALQNRLAVCEGEKRAIAGKALELTGDRQTLFLDGGTTCWALARLLAQQTTGLTIVTHSAFIAMECGKNRTNTVFCLGGAFDADSLCFVGPASEDAATRYFVDLAFFSTKGFLPDTGMFESSPANFRIKQIIARQAREVALLVDHTKFGQRGLSRVLDISRIHTIVTDEGVGEDDIDTLQRAGRRIAIATLAPAREESLNAV